MTSWDVRCFREARRRRVQNQAAALGLLFRECRWMQQLRRLAQLSPYRFDSAGLALPIQCDRVED